MANAVVHFEITSAMPKELHEFYSKAFGWRIDAENPMDYGIVDTNGGRGINGGIGPSQHGTPTVTFYVHTDDIAATLRKAESLGAKTLLPESQVMPGLSVGLFADPEGNSIGLFTPGPREGAEGQGDHSRASAGDGKPVTWFEIGGNDGAALQRFYTDLFGWEIHADNPMRYGEVHLEPIGGAVTPSPIGPYVTWYVETEDVSATLKSIESLGGKTLMPPTEMSNITVAMFADPEGNRIGLYRNNG